MLLPSINVISLSLNIAECSQMQKKLDLTITADRRREAACQQVIAYGKI